MTDSGLGGHGRSLTGPQVASADLGPGVRAGFTSRTGGVSRGAWAGLNLGLHVGDDPAAVVANRRLLAEWAGSPVHFVRQVHGRRVVVLSNAASAEAVDGGDPLSADLEPVTGADAVVTAAPGLPLGVLVGDCVPILLADVTVRVIAAAHAGRVGLLAGVVQATVRAMTSLGASPGSIRAVLGPAAGGCCYEVPLGMQEEACRSIPALLATTRTLRPGLDLRAGCRALLTATGVGDISEHPQCTIEDDRLFSYRRSGVTGRFAGVVTLLP